MFIYLIYNSGTKLWRLKIVFIAKIIIILINFGWGTCF